MKNGFPTILWEDINSIIMLVASIMFLVFGISGSIKALFAFPFLDEYNIIYAANLPWQVYYIVLLLGSLIYLSIGICGIIFRNKTNKYLFLRKICTVAFAYILTEAVLWFAVYANVYNEHISIAITEIIAGIIVSSLFLFSTFGK